MIKILVTDDFSNFYLIHLLYLHTLDRKILPLGSPSCPSESRIMSEDLPDISMATLIICKQVVFVFKFIIPKQCVAGGTENWEPMFVFINET